MAKLRHIALIVPDPEKAAKFFEEAFDMKVAGKARRGLYVSDGTVNVALLKQEGDEKVGIYHFGMWVDDLDEAEKKVVGAGGKYLAGRPDQSAPGATAHSYYEAKYKDPLGIVFGHVGKRQIADVQQVVDGALSRQGQRRPDDFQLVDGGSGHAQALICPAGSRCLVEGEVSPPPTPPCYAKSSPP